MSVLKVGFFADDTVKSGLSDARRPASTVAVTICYGNPNNKFLNKEGGTPAPIPARNFMKYTIDKYQDDWKEFVTNEIKKCIDNNKELDIEKIYKDLAPLIEQEILESMQEGAKFLALSKNTIKYRKEHGNTNNEPLIDSGELSTKIKSRIE